MTYVYDLTIWEPDKEGKDIVTSLYALYKAFVAGYRESILGIPSDLLDKDKESPEYEKFFSLKELHQRIYEFVKGKSDMFDYTSDCGVSFVVTRHPDGRVDISALKKKI